MAAIGVVVLCAAPPPTLAMIVRRIDADRTGFALRSRPEAEWVAYELRRALPQRA